MNSEVSGSATRGSRNWQVLLFRFIPQLSENTFRYFWLLMCALLALVALFNYTQTHQIQQDITKRRLLEVSLQDLIIQSTALQHLGTQHTYEAKLGLETRGYSSPQELLNQLAARLAIIESVPNPEPINGPTQKLRGILLDMDSQLTQQQRLRGQSVDRWFAELGTLNTAMNSITEQADDKIHTLQRNNLILTVLVLFHSVAFVTLTLWQQSKVRQRFASELLHLGNQARSDSLTGLLNRRGWQDMSEDYLRKMQRENQVQGSIAILDIDYFKQYNDTFGHDAGDVRLREFADTLRANFRPGDLIARVGGEEFAVLLPNCSAEDTRRIVDRIRLNGQCKVSFSAGIADMAMTDSIERCMAIADQALYQAKHKGRNRSCMGTVGS